MLPTRAKTGCAAGSSAYVHASHEVSCMHRLREDASDAPHTTPAPLPLRKWKHLPSLLSLLYSLHMDPLGRSTNIQSLLEGAEDSGHASSCR